MKIIRLEILNLASLDRQGGEVINFEEGALGDSNIFSIVGPTGSGKSTLLDAICLALYGRAPRYPKKPGERKQGIVIYGQAEDGENNSISPSALIQAARLLESQNKKDEALKIYQTVKEKYVNSPAAMDIDKYIERLSK